jgi:sortase A
MRIGYNLFMGTRTSPASSLGCLVNLLVVGGLLLVVAGGLVIYPLIRDALLPPPAGFGEAPPPLLPTVTPLPFNGQRSSPPPPGLLPETPLLAQGQTVPPAVGTEPVIADTSATIPTRIVIPAIHLDAPIERVGWSLVQGVSMWDIPDHFAAGWLKTSAPLGQPGNTVLDGHHNIAGEVFRYLVNLNPGDLIEVYSNSELFSYTVVAKQILRDRDQPIEIRRQNATWIEPTLDERLTLVTCWPYTNNTHRLIIVAKPINSNPISSSP